MPLVRIDLAEGTSTERRQAVVDVIYTALHDVAGVPADDRFMVVSEHKPENLVLDPHFMVERTAEAMVVQITLNAGRTVEVKQRLYRAIADGLQERVGLRTEDVFISLVEVDKANWSFGAGLAQYVD